MDNGYLVKPHSFVKVSIIIKGEKYVEPITFRGEDLETQSKLLLNKALFPISLTPSDTPDAVTNISITAEGTTSYSLIMSEILMVIILCVTEQYLYSVPNF